MQLKLLKAWVTSIVKNFLIVLKRAIQKTAEAIGDLIGNKNADKITRSYYSSKSPKELHSKELH